MRWVLLIAAAGCLAGCSSAQQSGEVSDSSSPKNQIVLKSTAPIPIVEKPTTRPAVIGTISLSGDIARPGQRDLRGGEKISDVLRTASLSVPASKLTVVLNRRCPEGLTSEMIDIDQNLAVLDPRRNYDLRDGDELVVSVVPSMPEGLARPIASDMQPTH